jgi:hypothetical protein
LRPRSSSSRLERAVYERDLLQPRRQLVQPRQHLEARHLGQADVAQHEVGNALEDRDESLVALVSDDDFESAFRKLFRDQACGLAIVLDAKDLLCRFRHPV